jgi:polar amino acid transport system permease protein/octopine/nopaline transport system permease protein
VSVDAGQVDAALALGLKRRHCFVLIVLPQAWRVALPGLGNVWMGLLKETALVSVIGLNDVLRVARIAAGSTHDPLPFLLATGVGYLFLTGLSLVVLRQLNERFSRAYGS